MPGRGDALKTIVLSLFVANLPQREEQLIVRTVLRGNTMASDGRGALRVPRTLEHDWNKWRLGERLGGETRPMFTGFIEENWSG